MWQAKRAVRALCHCGGCPKPKLDARLAPRMPVWWVLGLRGPLTAWCRLGAD